MASESARWLSLSYSTSAIGCQLLLDLIAGRVYERQPSTPVDAIRNLLEREREHTTTRACTPCLWTPGITQSAPGYGR